MIGHNSHGILATRLLTYVNLQAKGYVWLAGLSDSLGDRKRSPSLSRPLHLVRPAIYKIRVRVCAVLGLGSHRRELGNKVAQSLAGYAVAIPWNGGQSPRSFALPYSRRAPLAGKRSQRTRFRSTQKARSHGGRPHRSPSIRNPRLPPPPLCKYDLVGKRLVMV